MGNPDIKSAKIALRSEIRSKLRQLTASQWADASEHICQSAAPILEQSGNPESFVSSFAAQPGEVSLAALHDLLPHHSYVYPLCRPQRRLSFHLVANLGGLAPGTLGILEPIAGKHQEVSVCDIDVFLCPGLAFGRDGSRLGHGGGYYDRALAQRNSAAKLIGVCHSHQLMDTVPHEAHDVLMEGVITEEGYQSIDKIRS
ncbi:MAG: 5-formyltetrahydrofolate cyclo-ligase [Akkermansiaceae bacterium]